MGKKRIFITGSNGLLGQKVARAALTKAVVIGCDQSPVSALDGVVYHQLDITDGDKLEQVICKAAPDWVVHTAAITDVDLCEREQELAWQVNVVGTENVVKVCRRSGSKMAHLSTDYVFDGKTGPYREEDPPNPLGYYGRTKLESERSVLEAEAVVVRTMVLFGYEISVRPNFVTWAAGELKAGRRIRIVTDQWGNPTFADDLAETLLKLCREGATGLFHFSGADYVTRYDMVMKMAALFQSDPNLVIPITTSDLGQAARRPLKSGLRTDKIKEQFGIQPMGFEEALRQLMHQEAFERYIGTRLCPTKN